MSLPRQVFLIVALLVAIGLLLAGMALLSYQMVYAELIYPGVQVGGVPVGGLSLTQAEEKLAHELELRLRGILSFRYGEDVERFPLQEVGGQVDIPATVGAAYAVGREGGMLAELKAQWQALRNGWEVQPLNLLDEARVEAFLSRLAAEIECSPKPGKLKLVGLKPHLTPAQKGVALDREAALELIRREVLQPSGDEILLPVREIEPRHLEMASVKEQVSRILQAPLTLVYQESTWVWGDTGPTLRNTSHRWVLDRARLSEMLILAEVESEGGKALSATLDQGKLGDFVQAIAARIDQPTREARFDYAPHTGQLTPFLTSQDGHSLDITGTLKLINSQVTTPARTVVLPVVTEKPRIAMEDVASFGIVELVSKGMSSFKGSSADRVRNIRLSSSRFHGVVVRPGEVFSFNRFLGEVADAFGYRQSYIIFGDRTVLGAGGGVCQVSTTAFRAAFFGGFPIVERWPHTYRVGWYEPPLGLDATVFAPAVDFKFRNDSPAHLLVQTEVDARRGTLTFYFYGTKLPRTVALEGPHIENEIPHGEPIHEEDPSLPAGVTKQVDWAHDGVDVAIYRIVKEGDRVISRDRFFSRYKPWQARFLVGTREEA